MKILITGICGFSWTVVPIIWRNRGTGLPKLKIREMGSRYLLVRLSIWLEKYFGQRKGEAKDDGA
jgi:dolichol-phosphate mannosyltransferase